MRAAFSSASGDLHPNAADNQRYPSPQSHHLSNNSNPTSQNHDLDTDAQPPSADPPLSRRSAPIDQAWPPSAPLPPRPTTTAERSPLSFLSHLPFAGRSAASSTSAELARRLRGLMTAVNFRDVELMPQPHHDLGDGEDEDDEALGLAQPSEPDADAATGPTAASATSLVCGGMEAADRHSPADWHLGFDGNGAENGGRDGFGAGDATEGAAGPNGRPVEGRPRVYGGSCANGGATIGAGGGGVSSGGAAASIGTSAGNDTGRNGGGSARGVRSGGAVVRKNKLIIIMVGLPGRGKTFLCNKICCYLNWLGHATRHFNVGQYRRRQRGEHQVQDAAFFDKHNEAGMEARNRALNAALDDLMGWLRSDVGQVAVFDATNTTAERRELLRSKFHGVWQYLFIETICSDPAVLEQNYRNKMRYSPDYVGVDTDQAVADFLARIAKYEEVYEPIEDRNLHYIKLIDMVTGRGHMDINRISGYLPGKIVFFLMQVCKAGLTSARRIWLTRHGESEYNQKGLIGGDSSLSERGQRYSTALPGALLSRLAEVADPKVSVAVWTSTLKRTIETARYLPFPKLRWKALDEINAGICDGMTYEQIRQQYPEEFDARKKDKLRYRYPSGESYMDVIQRVEPVIIELERERECVVVVAHQAILRALYGYFMNVAPEDIPRETMELHTLIELTPMPDGTMKAVRYPIDISTPPTSMPGTPSSDIPTPPVADPVPDTAVTTQIAQDVTPKAEVAATVTNPVAVEATGESESDNGKNENGDLVRSESGPSGAVPVSDDMEMEPGTSQGSSLCGRLRGDNGAVPVSPARTTSDGNVSGEMDVEEAEVGEGEVEGKSMVVEQPRAVAAGV